jgi:hypothetical protein
VLINKYTDWDKFRENLDGLIDLKIRLKTTKELDEQAQNLVDAIYIATKNSTPIPKNTLVQETCYPLEIREMIKKRRKARRTWQLSRQLEDKNTFNRINNQLNRLIKDMNKRNFEAYLENLIANDDTNYSLWKATRKFKRPVTRILKLKDEFEEWVRDKGKADVFARYLPRVFQTHDI